MKKKLVNKLNGVVVFICLLLISAACASLPRSSPSQQGSSATGPAPPGSGPTPAQLFQQGLDFFKQFKYQEAKGRFDGTIDLNPNHLQAHYYRGRTLVELKQTGAADRDFSKCLLLDPNYAYGYVGKAQVLMLNKDFDNAMKQVEKALSLEPRNAEALFQKGNVYAYQKKWKPAINAYKECLAIQPDHAYAHYYIGLAYNQINNKNLAIDHLQKFLHLAPNAPEADQVRKLLSRFQR